MPLTIFAKKLHHRCSNGFASQCQELLFTGALRKNCSENVCENTWSRVFLCKIAGCRNYGFTENWLRGKYFLEHLRIFQSICFPEKFCWSTSECSSNLICYVGSSHNFKKQTFSTIDSLQTPYDFLSIMHYSKTAFGNGKVTIITKDPTMQEKIGQRDRMSDVDAIQLNRLYKCGIWYHFLISDPFSNKTNIRANTCFYYSVF